MLIYRYLNAHYNTSILNLGIKNQSYTKYTNLFFLHYKNNGFFIRLKNKNPHKPLKIFRKAIIKQVHVNPTKGISAIDVKKEPIAEPKRSVL